MKNLSYLVIFVALGTLLHQSSGNEQHIREKISKAHHEAKGRLAPSGKSKSLVSTRETFDGIVSFLRGRTITFNNTCVNAFFNNTIPSLSLKWYCNTFVAIP
jgi:hypothetical protein